MLPVKCVRFPVLSYLQSKDLKLIVIPILLMSVVLHLHGTVTFYRNLIKTPEYSHLTDFVPRLLDNNKGKQSCANLMKQNYVSS